MAALNTAIFEASNTYTGPTVISSGSLIVQSRQPGSPVQLSGGRLLGQLAEVGPLTATGGTIYPFFGGPSTLDVSGSLSLNSAATIEVSFGKDSNGTATASMLDVAGAVNLGGSNLELNSFFAAPQAGDQVTIINNDGTDPVVGTFGSLPEGASFAFGNATLQISYQGGDGNDVVLRVTAVAPVGIGLVKLTNGTDNVHRRDRQCTWAVPSLSLCGHKYRKHALEGVRVKDDNGTPGIPGDDFNATFVRATPMKRPLDPGETFIQRRSHCDRGQYTNIGEDGVAGCLRSNITARNATSLRRDRHRRVSANIRACAWKLATTCDRRLTLPVRK